MKVKRKYPKKRKWTDARIQKLFDKDVLSKVHSAYFNFGSIFLYADMDEKTPEIKIVSNQIYHKSITMLSNALHLLVRERTSPINAHNFKEELSLMLSEVIMNLDGGEA